MRERGDRVREEWVRAPVCICVIKRSAHNIQFSGASWNWKSVWVLRIHMYVWRTVWYSFLRQLTLNLDSLCAPYAFASFFALFIYAAAVATTSVVVVVFFHSGLFYSLVCCVHTLFVLIPAFPFSRFFHLRLCYYSMSVYCI